MNQYESEDFQKLLSRYETAKRKGVFCYLDTDDFVSLSDYYLDNDSSDEALRAVDEGLKQHPGDEYLLVVRAGVLVYLHRFGQALKIVSGLDAEKNFDVYYLQAQLAYAIDDDKKRSERLFRTWLEEVEADWRYGEQPGTNSLDFNADDDEDLDEIDPEEAEEEVRSAYIHIMTSYTDLADHEHEKEVRKWIEEYLDRFKPLGAYEADKSLAEVCRNEDLMDLAVRVYTAMLDHDPYTPHAWTMLSAAYNLLEKYDEALNAADYALAVDPEDSDAVRLRAHSLYNQGRYEEALPVFEDFVSITNSHTEDVCIAYCCAQVGDKKKAVDYLRSAAAFTSENRKFTPAERAWNYYEIAQGLYPLQHYDEAIKMVDQAIECDSKRYDFMLLRGTLMLAKHNFNDALVDLHFAIQSTSDTFATCVEIASRLLAYGYNVAAEDLVDTAFNLVPDYDDKDTVGRAHIFHALAAYRQGKEKEAKADVRKACKASLPAVCDVFATLSADAKPDQVFACVQSFDK